MTALAAMTALKATQYLTGDPNRLDPLFRDKYLSHFPVVFTHAVCAITALVIGPFQFLAASRRRWPSIHRIAGRVYMLANCGGGISGFIMGTMAFGDILAQTGFCIMATLWLATGWRGFAAARAGHIPEHRRWMIRNYAVAFGAVTLRLQLSLLEYAGFDFAAIYPFVAWSAWIPNLLAAESMIRLRVHPAVRVSINSPRKVA